jgi:rRNA maturation RNase YbeY
MRGVSKILGLCGELSLSLVDDSEMGGLNRAYRNIRGSTDVLAFAFQEGTDFSKTDIIGEVVVSVETAERQAKRRRSPLQTEVEDLFVHGILHLLGYDHTASREKALEMRRKEGEVRRLLDQSKKP